MRVRDHGVVGMAAGGVRMCGESDCAALDLSRAAAAAAAAAAARVPLGPRGARGPLVAASLAAGWAAPGPRPPAPRRREGLSLLCVFTSCVV